jgi:hypothetical protein
VLALSQSGREGEVEPALRAHDVEKAARRLAARDATLNEAEITTVATERMDTWKEVPLWRPVKRWRAFRAAKRADPFFEKQSLLAQFNEFVQDSHWDVAQPVRDEMLKSIKELDEEAFLLPKQTQRGRLTVLLDYRVFLQFYYDKQVGVIARKRPGTDLFLERLYNHVDLVLVCDRARSDVEQFLWKIDPLARFSVRMYRQALVQKHYQLYKPMHKLGRNMARVIVIDQSLAVSRDHEDNVIVLKPWGGFGLENTCDLIELLPFILQMSKGNDDVRDHIRKFKEDGIYIPQFYHKTRLLAQQYDYKKMNPLATNVVQLNPTPDFFDAGTLPEVDPWDDEPDSMVMPAPGGRRRRVSVDPDDTYSRAYKLLQQAPADEEALAASDAELQEFLKKFPQKDKGPITSVKEMLK